MITAIAKAHQFLTFTVNSSIQRAVAYGLNEETQFYLTLGAVLDQKRQLLQGRLTQIGFSVLPAEGTYFLVADFEPLLPLLGVGIEEEQGQDVEFCRRMTREAGVTLIPVSAFYEDGAGAPKNLVRFVVCKTDEKLLAACDKLEAYFAVKRKERGL